MFAKFFQAGVALAVAFAPGSARLGPSIDYANSNVRPPLPPREFRAAWVATVNNIDWPSRPGLTTDEQKKEIIALVERAAQLRLNAILFQVRTSCDAFYVSSYEPWSEYLSGRMGQGPEPGYDPLAFIIEQAHRNGLELHAWFNPFRARHPSGRSAVSNQHITQRKPGWVRRYGGNLWLDPSDKGVHDHTLNVIMDVVRRYDIDGVHLDDYFYPYPEKTAEGRWMDFPDSAAWNRYVKAGGRLTRNDWRRENVNTFVHRLYRSVKAEKPQVKVGISPFGIWRPGFPAGIRGLDAYDAIYADARKWLREGWLDYFSPQLYWPIQAREQSYPVLLRWWREQNVKGRHLWPGNAINGTGPNRPAAETVKQVALTRREPGAEGNIFWSMKALRENRGGIGTILKREVYSQAALVPASPWLDTKAPLAPRIGFSRNQGVVVHWQSTGGEGVRLWLLQTRTGQRWATQVLPAQSTMSALPQPLPDVVAVSAVSRTGIVGPASVVEKKPRVPPPKPARTGAAGGSGRGGAAAKNN